jgi:transposase InsO family protein
MTAIDTRQSMTLMAIAQHHGRPGTPTDQAHVESFFSHLASQLADHHHIRRRPARPRRELAQLRERHPIPRHVPFGQIRPERPQIARIRLDRVQRTLDPGQPP